MLSIYAPQAPIQWAWISLGGPDAKDFLHRLTTADVKNLHLGQGTPGCLLTAQGKFRSWFTLWNYAESEYAFEFDAGQTGQWKTDLLSAIDQFTFAEKLTLTDVAGLQCRWVFADKTAKLGVLQGLQAGETLATDGGLRVCHHGNLDYGRDWLTLWGTEEKLAAYPANVDFQQIENWRIHSLRPRTDAEITPQANPLEVGLLDAVATSKGCYPGQEVIEKIAALGSPARRLAKIEGQGPAPTPGDKIFNLAETPIEVGEITSVTRTTGSFAALGFIRKIHAKEGLEVKFENTNGSHASITQVAPYA